MHKNATELYNMITSKTTLGLMAIFAASVLVTGALVGAPSSYASGDNHKDKSKDKDGISGDGNTNLKFTNVNKPNIGGWDADAENLQSNCIAFKGADCLAFFD
jgi:hypothetical protein